MIKISCYGLMFFTIIVLTSCSRVITKSNANLNSEYLLPEYVLNSKVPLQINQYYSPRVVNLESGKWLAYELHLSNYYTSNIRIDGVEVLSDTVNKKYLYRNTGQDFKLNFKNLSYLPDSLKTTLHPGNGGIIFIWLQLPQGIVPKLLYHRLLIELLGKKMSVTTHAFPVQKTEAIVISPPVKGLWLVGQGVDPEVKSTEGHNRLLYPQFGNIKMPQRFATDWVKLGQNNKVFTGDSSVNENYYGFGSDVFAVADGVIIETQNDVPENIPPEMTVPRTPKNIMGNYLILKLKNGKSVFYGHLQTGSVQVKLGERVKSGKLLAKVGNTGNSTGAHLHFQIQDGNHFFDEGYPYAFTSIDKYGKASKQQIDDMADRGFSYTGKLTVVHLQNVLPIFGDIILFK